MILLSLFSNPFAVIFFLICIVLAVTIHEFAHAYAADKLGDPTPEMQGRVTLNPLAHLDPLGSLFFLLFGFGWGKPVSYDPFNLDNPLRDGAIIAFAGPASNIILVVASTLLYWIIFFIGGDTLAANIFLIFFEVLIQVNLLLALFNLFPIYPLDGFKIVGGLLPEEKAHEWFELQRYGFIFLLLLIVPFGGTSMAGFIIRSVISPIMGFLLP